MISNSGLLKLGDFGIGRQYDPEDKHFGGPTFGAPEYDVRIRRIRQTSVTSFSDIWSLGCVYLEFITWLLAGSAQVDAFADFRGVFDEESGIDSDEIFSIIKDDNGRVDGIVKPAVVEWTNALHEHERCSALIHDLLDLVMNHLVLIDPGKRMNASALHQRLTELIEKANKDHKYLLNPIPHPAESENGTRKRLANE